MRGGHAGLRAVLAPPTLIVFGAIDYAAAVAKIGSFLGYRVTVCDARPLFATPDRFPEAADVVVDWPDRYLQREAKAGNLDSRTAVCVLTHDPKFDVPVLSLALRLPRLGRRRDGLTEDPPGAPRAPAHRRVDRHRAVSAVESVGLDLGARTPEETAVSIAAEIIAARSGAQVSGCGISTANPSTRQVRRRPGVRPGQDRDSVSSSRRATAHAARNAAHLSPRSRQVSAAASTKGRRATDGLRSGCHAIPSRRGGGSGRMGMTATFGSFSSTVRSGSTA